MNNEVKELSSLHPNEINTTKLTMVE